MNQKIEEAINILKQADKEYIKTVLEREKHNLLYDCEYQGWCIGNEYVTNYLFNNENTYLNPKELEGFTEEIIEDIFPIEELAEDFISYYEAKWGLDNITEDKISSKITGDAEFHIFAHIGLCEEVIKQLEAKGIEVKS